MTWSATCLRNRFIDQLPGRTPGPEAGHLGIALEASQRVLELALDLGPGDRDLEVLLARADVLDLDVDLELALGFLLLPFLGLFLDGLIRHRNGGVAFFFAGAHLGLSLESHQAGTA